jgi:trypsin
MNIKGKGSKHKALRIIKHEKYGNFQNDIALIQIDGEFDFSDGSRKIINLGAKEVPAGDEIVVSGWGRTSTGGSLPTNLKWNVLKKVDDKSEDFKAFWFLGIFKFFLLFQLVEMSLDLPMV